MSTQTHIFRLHPREKGTDGHDWFEVSPYGDTQITAIPDPEGGKGKLLPTAIPTPFARFDLVQTAFANLSKNSTLKTERHGTVVSGSEEEEKLVSDALDVLELLFNADNFNDQLRIIPWDPQLHLPELTSGRSNHKRTGDALSMYIRQDKQQYNFELMQRLYLVVYNHQVVGCTSPVTLTAGTGNKLHNAQISLGGNYTIFDSSYEALYERDEKFQLFLYRFRAAHIDLFTDNFKAVNEYLKANQEVLRIKNGALFNIIQNIKPEDYAANYPELNPGATGGVLEVLGASLRKAKSQEIVDQVRKSDFVIAATKAVNGELPLLLQNELNKPFVYVQDRWDRGIEVPYLNTETDLNRRELPGVKIKYPYLTVSDFLEPVIIRTVFPLNNKYYFDGNLKIDGGSKHQGYLIPVRRRFFDYFTVADLKRSHNDGKPWFELCQLPGETVVAELRLPIKKSGEYITFTRTYTPPANSYDVPKADEAANKGVITEHQAGITIFPFVRSGQPDKIKPAYRIQLIDRDITGLYSDTSPSLEFLEDNNVQEVIANSWRSQKKISNDVSTGYYALEHQFDTIRFSSSFASGLIIPLWQIYEGGDKEFQFSLDFGTSGTHIEMREGANGIPTPFSITKDIQAITLHDPERSVVGLDKAGAYLIRTKVNREFVPPVISRDSEFWFPQRTVLLTSSRAKKGKGTFSLVDSNIGFEYEKLGVHLDCEILTNIKWVGRNSDNSESVRLFLEQIMLMIRAKVLLNGGSLSRTRILWSFPYAMDSGRVGQLEKVIEDLYRDLFITGADVEESDALQKLVKLPESFGPFYFYEANQRLQGNTFERPSVSIDIGGGTTDVVMFLGKQPQAAASFRFAASALFGGIQHHDVGSNHPLLAKYIQYFEKELKANGYAVLNEILESIKNTRASGDLATFLFSLETNPMIRNRKPYNFNEILAGDDHLRIAFIFFYSAIVYHVAQLLKAFYLKRNETPVVPGNFLFSGNGSKLLNIVAPKTEVLAKIVQEIFSIVYEKPVTETISILLEKNNPKEATARGGLYFLGSRNNQVDFKALEYIYHPALPDGNNISYKEADKQFFSNYNQAMTEFGKAFETLNQRLSFKKELNVSQEAVSAFFPLLADNLPTTQQGFDMGKELDNIPDSSTELIAETLFFYPVVRTINAAWRVLAELK